MGFQLARWKRVRTRGVGAALVALALCSCSAVDVAYEHADWWMARRAMHYVDLDANQAKAVRTQFGVLHAWHRSHELPLYAQLLDHAAEQLQRGLTRNDVAWIMGVVNERWGVTSAELAHDLSPVLVTLKPQQVVQMANNLADENARFSKSQVELDSKKRARRRTEWLTDQVQKLTGELTPWQRARIASVPAATPEFPDVRLAERRRRQAQFLKLLREYHDPQTLQTAITGLLSAPREGASEDYRKSIARYEEQLIQMVLDLDRSLTPEQRSTAVSRLRKYAEQFRGIALGRT
jgi:uncharacterized protein DUF6279